MIFLTHFGMIWTSFHIYIFYTLFFFLIAPTLSPLRPDLAVIDSNGVILRDDFDSEPDLDSSIW